MTPVSGGFDRAQAILRAEKYMGVYGRVKPQSIARDVLAYEALLAAAEAERDDLRDEGSHRPDCHYQHRWQRACPVCKLIARAESAEDALRAVVKIHDDRFDRHEGYMSGLGLAGRIADSALAETTRDHLCIGGDCRPEWNWVREDCPVHGAREQLSSGLPEKTR